ncbi:MAG: hypothetical protein KUF77_15425 [Candidatus Thiodiazotropha sp. (ex Lucina aurantia)]|nr:hypothetical protein [Candidatus Thiodiazotropha sp. (ex Lucina pensylvanica)]MBT3041005.1 hypothetical protein [Candidatus Thiodiazotropha sp. (ex Codakia orbicularis)]MBV2099520.1 hypothetical protein [Candidatus Thiodiazotropha sp. (ex Codakia orbicularis)]MBV2104415.1 hypothetical protein [Candidatus Thiodiazotropha sp. (ex Lucina aurantia)]MBV2118803.1 hypothetical protein [Candidatus Thiodiazotropha sp. (ex Lucina aurantia)]
MNNAKEFRESIINQFGEKADVIISESWPYTDPYLSPKMFRPIWKKEDTEIFKLAAAVLTHSHFYRDLDIFLCYCDKSPFEWQMFLALMMGAKKRGIVSHFCPSDSSIHSDFSEKEIEACKFHLTIQPQYKTGNHRIDFKLEMFYASTVEVEGKLLNNDQHEQLFLECDSKTHHRLKPDQIKKDYEKNYYLNSNYHGEIFRIDSEDFWGDPLKYSLMVIDRMAHIVIKGVRAIEGFSNMLSWET